MRRITTRKYNTYRASRAIFLSMAVILSLLLALSAQAGPIHWLKHQVNEHPVRTKIVFAGVSAGVYAEGLHQCRVVNVENCDSHYGAAWGSYTATVSLDVVAQIIGHKLGGKQGNAIAYGGSATMLGWGAYEWKGGLNKPRDDFHLDLKGSHAQ